MKIAIAGKGGVGKTTICSALARLMGQEGEKVFAIDADPNANLATSLGFSPEEAESSMPIVEMKSLIEERTGAKPGSTGLYFRLNPKVSDIPDRFKKEFKGVMFLQLGAMKEPSSGCYCPENALLKSLLMNLMLQRDETIILDMEAGFEHLTRGTAQAFDVMIIVIEPTLRAVSTARRISALAGKIGIKRIYYLGNKVGDDAERDFIERQIPNDQLLGIISHSTEIRKAELEGQSPFDASAKLVEEIIKIRSKLSDMISAAIEG